MRELTVQVEANAHAPRISRTYLTGMKSALGRRFHDVSLVLSELVTNSVRHGRGTSEVELVIDTLDSRVRLEVTDTGPCFAKDHPRGDGIGLHIVDQIVDEWGVVDDEGCTVWAVIKLD